MDDRFQSITGAVTESPKPSRNSSTTSLPATKKLQPKQTTSTANSPAPSREASPNRPSLRSVAGGRSTPGPGRSRKNSTQDISPARSASSITNPPSAAATQRALSATTTPTLHPASSDSSIKAPVPQKLSLNPEIRETPRWPISPRLRSPPPINKSLSVLSPRKAEHDVPTTNDQQTHSLDHVEGKQSIKGSEPDAVSDTGMRTPVRGVSGTSSTLETVQEISLPNTPAYNTDGALEIGRRASQTNESDTSTDNGSVRTIKAKPSTANESGSESGKSDAKMRSNSVAQPNLRSNAPPPASKTFSVGAGRGKPSGEGSTRNMTVETETVSSVPQVAVGPIGGGNNGSIRTKLSTETIRPKKDKKKPARKAPSVTSNTASSKADIFEAKVASAVDEANSTDSEETFVYESNPPDISDRPRRFHSRTPSATSMASQADHRNGLRSAVDGQHSVAMKKSMKFTNSAYSNNASDVAGDDDGRGTARSNAGTGRGTTHHHGHIGGRWSRQNGGNGHPSLFDNESPFPNAAKSKIAGNATRNISGATSPRLANMRMAGNGRKSSPMSSGYDLDDGADDERTPLVGTMRSSRSARRRNYNRQYMSAQDIPDDKSILARVGTVMVLVVMVILVLSGIIAFMFATSQPLTDVKITALKNVLASEQDVIFDMQVRARNPNLVGVQIEYGNIFIFAKSKYAGTDIEWWRKPNPGESILRRLRRGLRTRDDDPADPPTGDDPGANPNLEIGHIYTLDSPLTFDGSPFQNSVSTSTGQIRIDHPGNHTTPAGSERWGRVLQHEFELLVRGTLKYTLPLSQKSHSIPVEGRITVEPNAADQDPDAVHIVIPRL